jgi:hypothetical protein
MRKIIWALPLATALAMAVGVPSASAATTQIYGTTGYTSTSDEQWSYVAPMHAGDCNMFASLFVSRPNSDGFAKVHFHFVTSTSRTSNFDQWHNSWKFLDRDGRQITTLGILDGLRMPTVNVTYDGAIDTTIKMTTNQWASIGNVLWTGDC